MTFLLSRNPSLRLSSFTRELRIGTITYNAFLTITSSRIRIRPHIQKTHANNYQVVKPEMQCLWFLFSWGLDALSWTGGQQSELMRKMEVSEMEEIQSMWNNFISFLFLSIYLYDFRTCSYGLSLEYLEPRPHLTHILTFSISPSPSVRSLHNL